MGNGTFSNLNVGLPGVVWSSVAWGDMDNDGRLDMLITGSGATSLVSQVWQNLTPLANSPPAAPNGLSALVTSNSVLLSWNPASDAQTPAMGLSYNLRVGTTPGGGDIVSANSDPATGLRRVAQLGNCGERLFAVVTNLSVGTNYYWSVQAVDTSFAGSAFATERNFNLNVPEVVTLPASDITSTSAALNGSLTFNNQNTATWFQYGTTTNYGGTTPLTYVSSSTPNQALSSLITGLLRGTLYHYRIVATNSEGTGFGSDLTFTTSTPFTNIASALPAVAFGSAAWADFDNDGKLDLVLTGLGTNGSPISQVWRNLGNGSFHQFEPASARRFLQLSGLWRF
jgi:hypothetical protein